MATYIKQRYVCDICGHERATFEQHVPAGTMPQVLDRHNLMSNCGTLMDVCNECWPDLIKAFSALRSQKLSSA